ncbi:MAG: SGNH/GDSL hydrolase family protein [Gammaproteobacteria bacterium]|nr:SGNH/GDSL hydrolase family protein [Gammaproteobacteria bacterium]
MNNFRLLKIGFAFLFLVSSWAQADNGFSRVYVFGDSLSDTGNAASVVGDFPPPFFMNRVSNGPVAVETLATRLGLNAEASLHLISPAIGSNYAVAGASARTSADLNDLDNQIIFFLANHAAGAPADALYVVFIGGNDIRDAREEADFTKARNIVKEAADKVKNAIETLAGAGAESFLLVNAPDVGLIPETQLTSTLLGDPKLIKRTSRLSKLYRKRLHRIANQFDDYGNEIEIVEFDLFKFLRKLLRKADKLGFANTTDPCFSTSLYLPDSFFHPDCNFDQFVFFDEIHLTARAHALAGEAMFEALEEDGDDDDDDDSDSDSE